MRSRLINILALALMTAGANLAVAGDGPTTPEAVWEGFDPRAEPLEIEVIRVWNEDGASRREVRFTGLTHEGSKVRVYAITSVPGGTKQSPGILHIHGGGQTVAPTWLKFWNDRGYAAMTFNWGGEWDGRDKFTDWGKLKHANHKYAGAQATATEPSVRASSWYYWTLVCMRALTCLEETPGVDRDRLGIFGVSMGGTIAWPMAAIDRRVKAACAIYGVGWNTYPDEVGAPDPAAEIASTRIWRATMESDAYAALVKCPMLFLNATNDQHGNMDRSFATLERVKTEVRWANTPRYRHHITDAEGIDLPLWMDAHLRNGKPFPKTPDAALSLDAHGLPTLRVVPDDSQPVKLVEAYYAVENRNPKNRYWRSARVEGQGKSSVASLPLLDTNSPLFAFANVTYESGVCLSSRLTEAIPKAIGGARATDTCSLVLNDPLARNGGWVTSSPATDPVLPVPSLIRDATGLDGSPAVTVTGPIALGTHIVGDPKWRGPAGSKLEFRVKVSAPRTITVLMHEKEFAIGWTPYSSKIILEPGPGWRTISLAAGDFRTEKGELLKGWDGARQLEIKTSGGQGDEPVYSDFHWKRD